MLFVRGLNCQTRPKVSSQKPNPGTYGRKKALKEVPSFLEEHRHLSQMEPVLGLLVFFKEYKNIIAQNESENQVLL
jgi:hypothetical protein